MAFADGLADFRSDTVTRPTAEMYEAMMSAPLGDDVYHDDPTVLALEEEAAAAVGMEAAIYVPTGTMGNQLAVMFHTNPGEEVLAHVDSHVRSVEGGAPQALSGVGFRTVDHEGGRIHPGDIDAALEMAGFFPRIGLLVWENTHNLAGGRVIPFDLMMETSARAVELGLKVHIDGARIFNAVAATGIPADRWASKADTIQFCFSKGLGAPIGSITCGRQEDIAEIRYLRKRLGGGMRQAGVLAAAARVALAGRERLVEDHVLAQKLGEAFAARHPGSVALDLVETNMVQIEFSALGMSWDEVLHRLSSSGIKANPPMRGKWRLVTHRDVDATDADRLIAALS